MTAVEDARGITHAIVLWPEWELAGITACNVRFTTGEMVVTMGMGRRFMRPSERMAPTSAEVTCMACIAGLVAYHEA